MGSDEDYDPSDNDTQKYPKLKEDDVNRLMEEFKDFAAIKCYNMIIVIIKYNSALFLVT